MNPHICNPTPQSAREGIRITLVQKGHKESNKLTFQRQHSVSGANPFLLLVQLLQRKQSFFLHELHLLHRFRYKSAGVYPTATPFVSFCNEGLTTFLHLDGGGEDVDGLLGGYFFELLKYPASV